MICLRARVIENVPLAEKTFRIRFEAPEIASAIRPGQFLMMKLPGSDPLLARPFALYDVALDRRAIDVVYLVIGKMTGQLAGLQAGAEIDVWGPLGNGFPELEEQKEVLLVAGGIGQTPFLAYTHQLLGTKGYGGQPARRRVEKVSLYYGVRMHSLLAGVADFEAAGAQVHIASDDGSKGSRGFVTDLVDSHNPRFPLIGCGPEPMLHSLTKVAAKHKQKCYLSLETPMACGFGACFSCVTKVKCDGEAGWDYKRVCIEGPVFEAEKLIF